MYPDVMYNSNKGDKHLGGGVKQSEPSMDPCIDDEVIF